MKKLKKLTAVILIAALALSLSACGSFGMRMFFAGQKMSRLKSWSMDTHVDLGMSFSVLGQPLDLDTVIDGRADVTAEPPAARLDLDVTALGETTGIRSYYEQNGEVCTAYATSNGGKSWSTETLALDDMPARLPDREELKELAALASVFEERGKESIRGSEATVYAGTVSGEDAAKLLEATGTLDSLLRGFGLDASKLPHDFSGSIPMTIALDNKSGMIVRVTMDLTALMKELLPSLLDVLSDELAGRIGFSGLNLGLLGSGLDVTRCTVVEELYNFNAVSTIEIPAEARAALSGAAA